MVREGDEDLHYRTKDIIHECCCEYKGQSFRSRSIIQGAYYFSPGFLFQGTCFSFSRSEEAEPITQRKQLGKGLVSTKNFEPDDIMVDEFVKSCFIILLIQNRVPSLI